MAGSESRPSDGFGGEGVEAGELRRASLPRRSASAATSLQQDKTIFMTP